MGRGLPFRLLFRDGPTIGELRVVMDRAHGRLAQGVDHFPFSIHQMVFHLRQDVPEERSDEQEDDEQDRHEYLGRDDSRQWWFDGMFHDVARMARRAGFLAALRGGILAGVVDEREAPE